MSSGIIKKLHAWILPKVCRKICLYDDNRIPRSGERGESVNCFIVNINQESEPYLLVKSIEGDKINGLKWNEAESRFCDELTLNIDSINDKDILITHFYGLHTIQFTGIKSFIFHRIFFLIYIQVQISSLTQKVSQFLFNKKKIVTMTKVDLLKFMLEYQLERNHSGISTAHLMKKLYSGKIFGRPDFSSLHSKIRFYLDALVISEDIELIRSDYVVTGKAVTTLEKHEENERRHRESVILQRIIAVLTFGLLFFTAAQAGAIKLPTIWDLTENVETTALHEDSVSSSDENQDLPQ